MNKKLKTLLILSTLTTSTIAVSCGTTTSANTNKPGRGDSGTDDKNKKQEPSPQELRDKAIESFVKENKINDNYYKYDGQKDNNPFLKDWDYWFAKPSYVLKSYDVTDVQNWKAHISHPYMNLNDYNAIIKAYDVKIQSDSLYQTKKARFEKWAKEEFDFHPADAKLKGTALNINVSERNYNGDLYQLINDVVNDKINIDEQTKENFYKEVLAYLKLASGKNTYTVIKKDDDNNYLISDSDLDKFANESYNQYQSKYLRYFATTPNEESGVKILTDAFKELRNFAKKFIGLDDQQENIKAKPEDIPLLNLVNGNYYAQRIRTWFSYVFADYDKGLIKIKTFHIAII
ncbi:hypothetical protein ACR82Z_04685 [Mycoplasma sp. 6243]|uniref:hypothetical protein n=1 Tax=Mycoplasma sp. 6243 TaxID=3440865 RepID=UPI003EBE5E2E